MRTDYLLGAALICVVLAGMLGIPWVAGGDGLVGEISAGLGLLGLLLLVAAIANSYINDVREGYRSAREE